MPLKEDEGRYFNTLSYFSTNVTRSRYLKTIMLNLLLTN